MDQKYANGMPLYRQEQYFKRLGIELSRQNFANWVIKGTELFEPLYNYLHKLLIGQDIIMADETTVQALNELGKAPTSKSYMWLYRSGRYSPAIVLYIINHQKRVYIPNNS